jgi:hypothetical protein
MRHELAYGDPYVQVPCDHCRAEYHLYMLSDRVWEMITPNKSRNARGDLGGSLCPLCALHILANRLYGSDASL